MNNLLNNIDSKSVWLFTILCFSLILSNCNKKEEMTMKDKPNHDLAALNKLIQFPFQPLDSTWQIINLVPGKEQGNDWGIIAILTFNSSRFDEIIKKSPELDYHVNPDIPNLDKLQWLPQEVKTLLNPRLEEEGENTEFTPKSPDLFVKSPLIHGFIAPIGKKTKILLFLYTM
jgi:hypothetical protein